MFLVFWMCIITKEAVFPLIGRREVCFKLLGEGPFCNFLSVFGCNFLVNMVFL